MPETWINYSTEESKYGGQIIFFKSAEQLRGYPRLLKTVVTDADGRTVKVLYKTYIPEMRNYQTITCMNGSEKKMSKNNPEEMVENYVTAIKSLLNASIEEKTTIIPSPGFVRVRMKGGIISDKLIRAAVALADSTGGTVTIERVSRHTELVVSHGVE